MKTPSAYQKRKKIKQKHVAESVGVAQSFISQIVTGRRPCPRGLALKLEKVTGIKKEIWVWGTPKQIRQSMSEYLSSGQGEHP
ncbi:helix-turn-helix transcriptional regulator [Desulfosarcina sp. OttesenSCG-928-A07]|nr:helix-turn-helix transcriptional regulator [Desulfosarcina sp. OttesenSCG-928-G17]MDL2329055.1 helix-turn-helix transcriptional regulator [Desulfosarcina sp. OttesenSCG-928-A07]